MTFFISYRELTSLGLLDEFKAFEAAKSKGEEFKVSERLKNYFKRNNLYGYNSSDFMRSTYNKASTAD